MIGVPAFFRHPAGGLAGEAQHRLLFWAAGEDAEGGGEIGAQLVVADLVAGGFQGDNIAHPFQGEDAQGLAGVAEHRQVPVAPVVDELLRRDLAGGDPVLAAAMVVEFHAAAGEQGGGRGAEGQGTAEADADALKGDAAAQLVGFEAARRQLFFDTVPQGLQLEFEQAGAELLDQLVDGQQGMEFRDVEPQAGELEGVVLALVEDIALGLLIETDRRAVLAQRSDVAFQGCRGVVDQGEEVVQFDGIASCGENLVEFLETVDLCHGMVAEMLLLMVGRLDVDRAGRGVALSVNGNCLP